MLSWHSTSYCLRFTRSVTARIMTSGIRVRMKHICCCMDKSAMLLVLRAHPRMCPSNSRCHRSSNLHRFGPQLFLVQLLLPVALFDSCIINNYLRQRLKVWQHLFLVQCSQIPASACVNVEQFISYLSMPAEAIMVSFSCSAIFERSKTSL